MPHRRPTAHAPLPRRCRAAPLAFDAFFQRWHQPFLRYAAMRLWNTATAQAAVLETALRIQQNWDQILAEPAPAAVAFSILNDTVDAFTPVPDRLPSPIESALSALEGQAPQQAQCLRLRHLIELPYDAVAALLDINTDLAKNQTWQGMRFLDRTLNPPPTAESTPL